MRDNCICETLVDGMDFTEEAGVLALIAPRAVQICNHLQDRIPAFYPSEMLRSFENARPVFDMLGVKENLDYKLFDLPHGFLAADRESMLGWFDLHLKNIGTGAPKKEKPFTILDETELMVFADGKRDSRVITTEQYCKQRGNDLRKELLNLTTFDVDLKRNALRSVLRMHKMPSVEKVNQYSEINGWKRITLETSDGKLIPVLHMMPRLRSAGYVIISNIAGSQNIDSEIIDEWNKKGSGIILFDLSGIGESGSRGAKKYDNDLSFHTLSRAELWLGKTLLGEWAKELDAVISFFASEHDVRKISIDGSREAGLAALFLSAVGRGNVSGEKIGSDGHPLIENITLRDAPVSYLFDQRENVNFFSMAIHLPGFLNWGDISLAAAISGKDITFINPLSMSGRPISGDERKRYNLEFARMRKLSGQRGHTSFK